MDEILDRLKSIKIKRKDLFLPLVLTEILGILVLLWYLRVPLAQKYLIVPPKSYSVDEMEEGKQYLLRQGDFIWGKSSPESKLQLLFYPGGQKYTLPTDDQGNFQFQIPQETAPLEYRLIIINNLTAIKDFKVRIISNNKLNHYPFCRLCDMD